MKAFAFLKQTHFNEVKQAGLDGRCKGCGVELSGLFELGLESCSVV
jgi:hypothetical protein